MSNPFFDNQAREGDGSNPFFGAEQSSYWRDAFRTMQESNAIGMPELIGQSGLNISISDIMSRSQAISEDLLAQPTQEEMISMLGPSPRTTGTREAMMGAPTPSPDLDPFSITDIMMREMEYSRRPEDMSFTEWRAEHSIDPVQESTRLSDIVTYPLQLRLQIINSQYEALRSGRRETPGEAREILLNLPKSKSLLEEVGRNIADPFGYRFIPGLDRLETAFAGPEWEGLHPDIQAVLWEPVKDALMSPLVPLGTTDPSGAVAAGLAQMLLLSGNPDAAINAAVKMEANQLALQDVMSGDPYTGEYEAAIHPIERGIRQFVTESLFDPLLYIPGTGGFTPSRKPIAPMATQADAMVNLLTGANVDPLTGRILPTWRTTTLAGGIRPPTLGEYIGWGTSQAHSAYRRLVDPFGGIRRWALRTERYHGANIELDAVKMAELDEYIRLIAQDSGIPEAEVRAAATQIIEEVLATDQFSLRGRTGRIVNDRVVPPKSVKPITAMSPEDVAVREAQRTLGDIPEPRAAGVSEDIAVLPSEQHRLFGETPEQVRGSEPRPADVIGMADTGEYRPGYIRPRGVGKDYIPGVTEPPILPEAPGQYQLIGTPKEMKPAIDSIMSVQEARFRRGMIATAPNRAVYEAMPMRQLERTLEVINNAFIGENVNRLAGVRVFQRAVRTRTGVRPVVLEATDSIIRELPGFREASAETINDMANLLYEASWDSLNVGPRAPLNREHAAGLLTQPLDSHLGYIEHIAADEMHQSYEIAVRRLGWSVGDTGFLEEGIKKAFRRPSAGNMNRQQLSNNVGRAIRHGSTRQRGFRGSISEGNRLASEGRVGWTWLDEPGAMPIQKILKKGKTVPTNWVPIEKMFDTDLVELIASRRASASKAVAGVEYLTGVSSRYGIYSPNTRPANAMSIFDLPTMSQNGNPTRAWTDAFGQLSSELQKRLKHTYFPNIWGEGDSARAVLKWNEIAQGKAWLEEMNGMERLFWGIHKPISKYWKSKTLFGFTAYHIRNHYDDCVRLATWFDNWTPGTLNEAFDTIYQGNVPDYVKEFIGKVKGVPAAEITADDVLYFARGEGAFNSGMYHDVVQRSLIHDMGPPSRGTGTTAIDRLGRGYVGAEKGEKLVHHPANPFSTNFIWDQTLKEFGMDAENMRRLSGFYAGMKEPGMTLERLGEKLRFVAIDYLDQDPIMRVVREFSPFIMFQRHAIPLNVRSLFERPGRVSMRLRAYDQLDRTSTEMYGRDDAPPVWNEGRSYRVGKNYWFLPSNFDSLFDIEDLLGDFTRFVGGDRAAGGKLVAEYLAPWITEVPEQTFNYDLYRGQPIYDRWEGDDVPKFLRDMGMSERMGVHLWHGIESTWRAARNLEGVWEIANGGKELRSVDMVRQWTGVPIYESDPVGNQHWLLKTNQSSLEQTGLGNTYGTWSVSGIEPDRYGRAAELFGERIITHLLVDEYLTQTPYDGDVRPFEENIERAGMPDIQSQKAMLDRIKNDLRGMWALQDKFDVDLENGRVRESQRPFTQADMQFISNFYNTIILTEIGLAKAALERGEITPQQAQSRIRSRTRELINQGGQ